MLKKLSVNERLAVGQMVDRMLIFTALASVSSRHKDMPESTHRRNAADHRLGIRYNTRLLKVT
jgi:hypothetical protein